MSVTTRALAAAILVRPLVASPAEIDADGRVAPWTVKPRRWRRDATE